MRQRDARNVLAFLIGLTLAVGLLVSTAGCAAAQTLSGRYDQHPERLAMDSTTYDRLMAGIDTARGENAFCLFGKAIQFPESDTVYVVVDSAKTPSDLRRFRDSVQFTCAPHSATAHWHLKHLGHIYYPSIIDVLGNVDDGSPFAVLVNEDGVAPFMVDERKIWHVPGKAQR